MVGCGSLLDSGRLPIETISVELMEVDGNNRSVMPLDVPGCTRVTLICVEGIDLVRKDRVIS